MYSRRTIWAVLSSVLVFQAHCANPPPPQTACGFVQNSEGQRVSWKKQLPIQLYLDASVPTQFYQAISSAIVTWEQSIGRKVFELAGTSTGTQPRQDSKSVLYWISTWDRTQMLQQANTTIYWVDTRISEADIRINASLNFETEKGYSSSIDIESLVLHELGHVMGLKHIDNVPSVMAKSLSNDTQRRVLFSTDVNDIKCEY